MPRFNQTGPAGIGPMICWGRGMCNTARPAYRPGADDNTGFGRSFRRRFSSEMRGYQGRGMGRSRGPYFQAYPEDAQLELGRLKNEAANMQNALEVINERITELEKSE